MSARPRGAAHPAGADRPRRAAGQGRERPVSAVGDRKVMERYQDQIEQFVDAALTGSVSPVAGLLAIFFETAGTERPCD